MGLIVIDRWTTLREVKPCVPTMQFFGGNVISAGSFFGSSEQAEVLIACVGANLCRPFGALSMPKHSLIARLTVPLDGSIAPVLDFGCGAKIVASIFKAVTINMIYAWRICIAKNYPVHQNKVSLAINPNVSLSIPATVTAMGIPLPLHEEVIVSSINDGDLSLRKGNLFGLRGLWGRIIHSKSPLRTCSSRRMVLAIAAVFSFPLLSIPQEYAS